MSVRVPFMPIRFAMASGRMRTLAVALVTTSGLVAAAACMLTRSDWWLAPVRQAERRSTPAISPGLARSSPG